MPMILPPVPDLVDFAETRVLIADDVADTGATLALVKEFCEGKVAEVRCAVLYEKPRSTVQLRVRLAAHRPLDRLPVERRRAGRRRRVASETRRCWKASSSRVAGRFPIVARTPRVQRLTVPEERST